MKKKLLFFGLFLVILWTSLSCSRTNKQDLIVPYQEGEFWGYVKNGKQFIEPKYMEAAPFYDGYAVAKKEDGKFVILSEDRTEKAIQEDYEVLESVPGSGHFEAKYSNNGEWRRPTGIIDPNGNTVLPFDYFQIDFFSKNNLWYCCDFQDNTYSLRNYQNESIEFGLGIDKRALYKLKECGEGFIRIIDWSGVMEHKTYFFDLHQKEIVFSGNGILDISNGKVFGYVKEDGRKNTTRQVVVQYDSFASKEKRMPELEEVTLFSNGRAFANRFNEDLWGGDLWVLIDTNFKTLGNHSYSEVRGSENLFEYGLEPVREPGTEENLKWGYIDKFGTLRIPFKYDEAFPFMEGLARVQMGASNGFIDTTGTLAIPMKYHIDWATGWDGFENGICEVKDRDNVFYIDKTGKEYRNLEFKKKKKEKTEAVIEETGPDQVSEKEMEKLLATRLKELVNDIQWGPDRETVVSGWENVTKVKELSALGGGANFKKVSNVTIHRKGTFDETKKRFLVEVSYKVDNGGMRKAEQDNVEIWVAQDDYGDKYVYPKK